ncbi:MAG: hypothetical protein K0R18_1929 [Bacillales bacterium]|jgi:hypothetical protein|nr:hypothetical protein [Bacillales bacterium]
MNFSIFLNDIENGWALLTFEDSQQSVTYSISNVLEDQLSKIIDNAIMLKNNQDSEIRLYLEPDEIYFNVTRKSQDEIILTIENYVFLVNKRRYINQVINAFESYVYCNSESDYLSQWKYEFPRKKLEVLRNGFKEL